MIDDKLAQKLMGLSGEVKPDQVDRQTPVKETDADVAVRPTPPVAPGRKPLFRN